MMTPPKSDWQLYNIPPPPRGLFIVLAAAVFSFLLFQFIYPAHGTQRQFDLPGGYAGRPPTTQQWPGRCWCKFHGPRGGCMQWVCRPK